VSRQYDELAENTYRRLAELSPRNGAYHYNLGVFLKTRGTFEKGLKSNRAAFEDIFANRVGKLDRPTNRWPKVRGTRRPRNHDHHVPRPRNTVPPSDSMAAVLSYARPAAIPRFHKPLALSRSLLGHAVSFRRGSEQLPIRALPTGLLTSRAWSPSIGTGGRHRLDSLVVFNRNRRSPSPGAPTCLACSQSSRRTCVTNVSLRALQSPLQGPSLIWKIREQPSSDSR
jgi:hypothetical protein